MEYMSFREEDVLRDAPTRVYQAGTVDYTPGMAGWSSASASSDSTLIPGGSSLSGHLGVLGDVRERLRDVFAGVRRETGAFRDPIMRGQFEKFLLSGIDGIGRAAAILLPSARGQG